MRILLIFFLSFILLIPLRVICDEKKDSKKNTKVVVIDPGHGGKDSGAMGKHSKEKDIVLAISLKVGEYLEENMHDVKVIYTRQNDTFIELHKRAEIANNNNADLFVSIHVNSNKSSKPSGTETYAMGLHKTKGNLEVAKKENSVIMIEEDYSTKYEGFDPNSPESYIIFSLLQNIYLDHSLEFASHVQDQFENRARRGNRGVKQAGFLVLWKTTMPSVLVETGFISNPEEEKYLLSKEGQDYLASAIYRAIRDYLKLNEVEEPRIPVKKEVIKDTVIVNENVSNSDVVFCIQIAASSKPLIDPVSYFSGLAVKEYKVGKYYKYTVEENFDFNTVKNSLSKIRQNYPDAFIIAFENGKNIALKKALEKNKLN